MSNAAEKTLEEILKRGVQGGAYYICGDDEFQKENATKKLIASALDPPMRDFNLDVLRTQDLDSKTFEGIISSMPMMADRRVVVIRDAGALKKDARKAVEQFLTKQSPDVLLLLVESAGGKTDKDLVKLATALEFKPLTADEVPTWITQLAMKEFRTQISSGAAELLHSAVGNDLHQLVTELDKLVSFTGGQGITEEAVAAVTGVRRGETMEDLLDVIGRRDIKTALELLGHVLGQPKTTAVQVVMLLSVQMVALAWGRARIEEGLAQGRLQGEFFNLLKQPRESGSLYLGRSWGSATTAWASMVPSWSCQSLERAVDALLMADVTLKETRLSSEEQVLTTLILTMCASDEHRIAA